QAVAGSLREEHAGGITVYNFEVVGDYTYFVADAETSFTDPIWVHNLCVGGKFMGTYKGKGVEFKNSSPGRVVFRKRPEAELTMLRNQFNSTGRTDFVKHVATMRSADLRAAGFSQKQIDNMMTTGTIRNPKFQVHHIKPLDGGGDNSFDYLIIIRQQPYHAALTTEQQRYVGDLGVGEEREIDFPLFSGMVVHNGG
ncbi:MAG: HNH endonuclease signature motif containing protein, partial [Phycisphaerae bacterium]